MTNSLPVGELNFNPSRVQRFTTLSITGGIYYDGPTELGHGLSSGVNGIFVRSKPFLRRVEPIIRFYPETLTDELYEISTLSE